MNPSRDQWTDPLWRLSNIYHITDEDGRDFAFRPNEEQLDFYKNLWWRNDILKARQLGFCVDPSTRVLTATLQWVAIESLEAGQEIVAVDEMSPGGKGQARRMRTARVVDVRGLMGEAFRVVFDDGRSVVCTDRHPWLSQKSQSDAKWRSLSGAGNRVVGKLGVGSKVRWITRPWGEPSFDDGWFGGMLDGEGSMSKDSSQAGVSVSQRAGPVWDRMLAYAAERGYSACIESDDAERLSKYGKVPVPKLAFGRMDELFRLIGQTRPTRFIGRRWWEGRELPGKRNGGVGWSTIVSIESVGERRMVDLQTTTGTYIAEGFVSHNTSWCSLIGLDQCLFNENFTAVQIAHTLDDAGKIFRNKVEYAYTHLPPGLRDRIPLKQQAAGKELLFKNGSSASVTTSARGGTTQFLHVSEFGKIARRYPEKAREILTGSFESVPSTGIIVVESTAEGNAGAYYDLTMEAIEVSKMKRELKALDFKLHFYPWYKKIGYQLDPSGVSFSPEDVAYFDKLERILGIKLTLPQRAWYVLKRKTVGKDMLREYPATPQEAFQQSVEGAIYAEEMSILRRLGRIGTVPFRTDTVVNTFWDLGASAGNATAIWFHQRYGSADRFPHFLQDTGKGLRHFFTKMVELQAEHGFKWGVHHLPHDGNARLQGAELQTRVEILEALIAEYGDLHKGFYGGEVVGIQRTTDLELAIQLCKRKLTTDVYIDEDGCSEGLRALDNYQYEWNEAGGKYSRSPLHNWASNPADAFRQWSQGYNPPGPQSVAGPQGGQDNGYINGSY